MWVCTEIFIDGNTGRRLTYADIRDQAKAFGIGLKSIWGWKRGDVMALYTYDAPCLSTSTEGAQFRAVCEL